MINRLGSLYWLYAPKAINCVYSLSLDSRIYEEHYNKQPMGALYI
jgi:hypothetical protein